MAVYFEKAMDNAEKTISLIFVNGVDLSKKPEGGIVFLQGSLIGFKHGEDIYICRGNVIGMTNDGSNTVGVYIDYADKNINRNSFEKMGA